MRNFFKFNDDNDFAIDTSTIVAFKCEDNTLEIYYMMSPEDKESETLYYKSNRKRDIDYDRLVEHLKVEQVKEEKRQHKKSVMQEAMQEVNELLGKNRHNHLDK